MNQQIRMKSLKITHKIIVSKHIESTLNNSKLTKIKSELANLIKQRTTFKVNKQANFTAPGIPRNFQIYFESKSKFFVNKTNVSLKITDEKKSVFH